MAMPHVHAGAVPDLLNTGLLLSNIYQNNVIHVCLLNIIEMLIAISMHILFSMLFSMFKLISCNYKQGMSLKYQSYIH
jgi:hypothetical protein